MCENPKMSHVLESMTLVHRHKTPPLWKKKLGGITISIVHKGISGYLITYTDSKLSTVDLAICKINNAGQISKWYTDSKDIRSILDKCMPEILAYIMADFVHEC